MVKVSWTLPLASVLAVDVMPLDRLVHIVGQKTKHSQNPSRIQAASQCWRKINRKVGFVFAQNPGAGLGDIEPFDRVLKDGMLKVGCVKDSMYLYGDKFGGNKHEYRVGDTQNVSIVHYNDHVPKEDQEKITPTVCFNFCRTIQDMGYFGILNGRECYCEPYYKALAGDSTECDSVCEGDNTQLCGSKSKSSIWEMHFCNDGAQQLAVAAVKAYAVQDHLDDLIPRAKKAAIGKQELAVELQGKFGKAGDPDAAGLMQKAKVSAGKLLHLAEDAEEARNTLKGKIADSTELTAIEPSNLDFGDDMQGGDLLSVMKDLVPGKKAAQFMDFEVSKKGDELTQELQALTPKANETYDSLQNLYLLSEPMINPYFYVHYGSCIVDETGCVQSRTDASGKYLPGDWCWIEVQGGEVELSVEKFDLNIYEYNWYGRTYNYPSAWLYFYNVETRSWNFYGGQPPPELKNVWWQSKKELEEKNKFHTGYIGWWSWYWAERKQGWKLCGVNQNKDDEERGIQYYPAMYFVDKEYRDAPMTCTGTMVEQPIYFKNYHGCAAACDARNQECVGFSYFPTGKNRPNMCFLFSNFKTGQYYTGCRKSSFLQRSNATAGIDQPLQDEPTDPVCVAKLSKFVGTTLEPNPEGKCKQCFKKLTEAKRCWN